MKRCRNRLYTFGGDHMSEKSKVYFADFRCFPMRENLPQMLARLIMTAGFGSIDMDNKYVAIKMHFGEPGESGISAAQLGQSGGRSGEGSGREAFFDGLQYAVCGRAKERFGPYRVRIPEWFQSIQHRLPHPYCRRAEGQRRCRGSGEWR